MNMSVCMCPLDCSHIVQPTDLEPWHNIPHVTVFLSFVKLYSVIIKCACLTFSGNAPKLRRDAHFERAEQRNAQ